MAVENNGVKTLRAAGTIGQYERVAINSSSEWAQVGVTTKADAIALKSVTVGQMLPAQLLNAAGTVKMKAAVAITAGAKVYGGASGKINVTSTNCLEGKAVTAATADGDIIEVIPMPVSAVTL
jgi:hypothetical protein